MPLVIEETETNEYSITGVNIKKRVVNGLSKANALDIQFVEKSEYGAIDLKDPNGATIFPELDSELQMVDAISIKTNLASEIFVPIIFNTVYAQICKQTSLDWNAELFDTPSVRMLEILNPTDFPISVMLVLSS
jgi:hypothetical protein